MYATHEAELDLLALPLAARRVHIVPNLRPSSLLSMAQLCDARCVVTFDATSVTVRRDNQCPLEGVRTPDSGLWHLSPPFPLLPALPYTRPHPPNSLRSPMLHYFPQRCPLSSWHLTAASSQIFGGSPPKPCKNTHRIWLPWSKDILTKLVKISVPPRPQNHRQSLAKKYPPHLVAMVKGHLDQARKNQRSTKTAEPNTTLMLPSGRS